MTVRVYSYKYVPTILRFSKSKAFMRALMGPFGSGKTSGCIMEIPRLAIQQEPDLDGVRRTRFAIVRNTFPQLRDTTIPTFMYWLGHLGDYKVSDFDFYLNKLTSPDGFPVECLVHFRALDKPQDVRNLLSLDLTGAFFNEVREIPKQIVDAMRGRVGRYPPRREDGSGGATWFGIWMDTNPPDTDHWFYKLFEEERPHACKTCRNPRDNGFVIYPAYDNGGNLIPLPERKCPICKRGIENAMPLTEIFKQPSGLSQEAENLPYLPPNYYQNLSAGQDQSFVNVYVHGQYGYVRDGKPVYANFDPNVHVSKQPLEPRAGYPLILACDNTGLNQAAVLMQYLPNGQVRVLQEWLVEGMGTRRLAEQVLKPALMSKYIGYEIYVTGDPAGVRRSDTDERTSFQELRDVLGIDPVPARSNSWEARFNAVDTMLTRRIGKDSEPALLISPHCRMLIKGFLGEYRMRRLRVSGQDRYEDRPEKGLISNVHDALQYGCLFIEDMYNTFIPRRNVSASLPPEDSSSWGAWT